MTRKRSVQGAAAKDTTKISAPAQKLDAASAEKTTKHPRETAQYSKEKQEERIPRLQAIRKLLRLKTHPE